jgi:hypothetical protein
MLHRSLTTRHFLTPGCTGTEFSTYLILCVTFGASKLQNIRRHQGWATAAMSQSNSNQSTGLKLEDPTGPSIWAAASQHQGNVPSSEWEYSMRKSLKDAAFTSLDYVPACTHMPVCAEGKCTAPRFVWVSAIAGFRDALTISKRLQMEVGAQCVHVVWCNICTRTSISRSSRCMTTNTDHNAPRTCLVDIKLLFHCLQKRK